MKERILTEQEVKRFAELEMVIARSRPNSPRGRELLGYPAPVIEYKPKEKPKLYLYFIRSGGLIKIGITQNIQSRMSAIKVSSAHPVELLKLISGGRMLEAELHDKFHHLRVHGEWFLETSELIKFIEVQK